MIACAMTLLVASLSGADPTRPDTAPPPARAGMKLVWSEEFAQDGPPDPATWNFEKGFARNQELQWYQAANAVCKGGVLRIEGRKERVTNPNYVAGSTDWKTSRQYAEYTSSSLTSSGKKLFQFGHWEIRARLDGQAGSWPAIWTLGSRGEWPTNGEVDQMEFYPSGGKPALHANVAWGTATRWQAAWSSQVRNLSTFTAKDPDWLRKFHVWAMDWNADTVRLSLDGEVLNTTLTSRTVNADGTNPYRDRSQYLMLNLAMGANGGDPSGATFPMVFEVDWVRVWQPAGTSLREEPTPTDLVVRGREVQWTALVDGPWELRVAEVSGRQSTVFQGFGHQGELVRAALPAHRGVLMVQRRGAKAFERPQLVWLGSE